MKRSEINKAIELAENRLKEYRFALPQFAYWTPLESRIKRDESIRVRANGLGWDITDFGSGNFSKVGAVLFTLRNGSINNPKEGTPYAEKIIVMIPGQEIPLHFHWTKTEDIINRGGGVMVMQLFNSCANEEVDTQSSVEVYCDGIKRSIDAGETLELMPGESITLVPGLYHRFWAKEDAGVLICGEVSSINDDSIDNRFAQPLPRFAEIEEDESPRYLLVNEN